MLTTKMREYRERIGITQVELAQRCGCRRETIGKLEAGKYNPSLKLAMDVARELDASVYDLFFFSEDEPPEVAVLHNIEYDSSRV
ncbi:MAG: helix-turn-helix transcriptional regulator [Atopobiaceae bacterium]|nr:helix-turn-helix transcriptional regulator [Atopobiaceae bacterium]MBR1830652.1 helix-turn-helix transcriptional regulator [Atopobiaceae bacterium]